ncbi:hypothetical protein ACFP7A_09050 [Sporolactobacillus kofuensis]|uniref:Uncharacterized protein n=1 Tax=Sporolactobacillus kofuensis TaxID=269672 RepID=A0ABW1WI38_9BACL|nr:hypothetical protein [Sporolactobacillus kofuensis]MCO7176130.1 hypothetical protein [Sporolactobacillus kofuensis]
MSIRKLIYEYKRSLREMKAAYEAADPDGDKPIIGGMIHDLECAIKWMESGRDPERYHMDADFQQQRKSWVILYYNESKV